MTRILWAIFCFGGLACALGCGGAGGPLGSGIDCDNTQSYCEASCKSNGGIVNHEGTELSSCDLSNMTVEGMQRYQQCGAEWRAACR
jgi:hypothetical protein